MEGNESIKTVNHEEDLKRCTSQGGNSKLKVNWRPATKSQAKETDTDMKETNKTAEGLAESKHTVKELTEE